MDDYLVAYLEAHPEWARRVKALSAWLIRQEKDAEAMRFLSANPDVPFAETALRLEEMGIVRGSTWVSDRMFELLRERARQA
jgi:hypothetical protein